LAYANSVYITQPSVNAIVKVDLSRVGSTTDVAGERQVTGSELVAFLPLDGGQSTLVALDSSGRMVMLDELAETLAEFLPQQDEFWTGPLTTASDGGFTAVKRDEQARLWLVHFDSRGARLAEYPVTLPVVFSGQEADGVVLLISRLTKRLQFIDLRDGSSSAMELAHDRPRAGVRLASGRWAIIHDTFPDIGITIAEIGREDGFAPFDDWYSAIAPTAAGGAIAVSFNGTLSTLDPTGRLQGRRFTGIGGLLRANPGSGESVWVTAENQGRAYRLNGSSHTLDARYWKPGLQAVAAFPGTNLLVASSARRLEYLKEER
jgi:hypothetical protein